MGIAVVTGIPAVASSNPASGLVPAGDGGVDFATMLMLQLADPKLAIPGNPAPATAARPASPEDENSGPAPQDPAALPFDPQSLLPALLASAVPVPVPQTAPERSPAPGGEADGLDPLAPRDKSAARAELPLLPAKEERTVAAATPDPTAATVPSRQQAPAASVPTDLVPPATGTETAIIAAEPQLAASPAGFADQLAAQAAAAHRLQRPESAAPAPMQVGTPVHDPRWSQDLGDKVVWLARNEVQSAQISINPPQLGPMQITLNVSGDQASAHFVSPHAEVRQAIQDAMPQLREMLAGAGINLGEANVGAQLPRQDPGRPQPSSNPSRSDDDEAILHADNGLGATTVPKTPRGRGMVDLFA